MPERQKAKSTGQSIVSDVGTSSEVQELKKLVRDYYDAACIGARDDDPSSYEEESYHERMQALMRRTEQLLNLEQEAEAVSQVVDTLLV